MGKTTVKPGNSHESEGGRMPSTTGKPSGGNRGNNPPSKPVKKAFLPITVLLAVILGTAILSSCKNNAGGDEPKDWWEGMTFFRNDFIGTWEMSSTGRYDVYILGEDGTLKFGRSVGDDSSLEKAKSAAETDSNPGTWSQVEGYENGRWATLSHNVGPYKSMLFLDETKQSAMFSNSPYNEAFGGLEFKKVIF